MVFVVPHVQVGDRPLAIDAAVRPEVHEYDLLPDKTSDSDVVTVHKPRGLGYLFCERVDLRLFSIDGSPVPRRHVGPGKCFLGTELPEVDDCCGDQENGYNKPDCPFFHSGINSQGVCC